MNMGLSSLPTYRSLRSPSLKSPSDASIGFGIEKQTPTKLPLSLSFSSSSPSSRSTLSSPTEAQTFSSSPASSPGTTSFTLPTSFSTSFKTKNLQVSTENAPRPSLQSPTVPESLVFRDLDRYPVVRSSAATGPGNNPPQPNPSAGRHFPQRQSSVKSSRSLLNPPPQNLSSPLHARAPLAGRVPPPLVISVPGVPEERSLESAISWTSTQLSSPTSDHTAAEFRAPASSSSVRTASRHRADGSSSSESSTSSIPLQAIEGRVAGQSLETTPRKIRISLSAESKRSLNPSTTTPSPMSVRDAIAPSMDESVYNLEYSDTDDNDIFKPTKQSSGKAGNAMGSLIEKTQSQMKKIHMPEYNLNSLKSSIRERKTPTAGASSLAQYNYDLVELLETDLQDVSTELAASIKREMDLEMLLDKYATTNDDDEAELTDGSTASPEEDNEENDSFRLKLRYSPQQFERLQKQLRNEQQEKAQMRLEFQQNLDKERQGRMECEKRRQKLEDQVKSKSKYGKKDALMNANIEANETIKSLEAALEDAQRKLYNERTNAQNLEFMLTGLCEELHEMSGKPIERADRARSSIMSMTMMQRMQARGNSADGTDPVSLTTKIEELETQKDELQQALRHLKDSHQVESNDSAQRILFLHAQLARSRDVAKTIASRRKANETDLRRIQYQLSQMQAKLSIAQTEKTSLSNTLEELKQKVLNLDSERVRAENTARKSAELEMTKGFNDRIEDLTANLNQKIAEVNLLTSNLDKEQAESRRMTERVARAEERQQSAEKAAEEHQTLLRSLSANRRELQSEHARMTSELESSTKKFEEFANQIQNHIASNRSFASKFSTSVRSLQD
ncbi:hypothetical protein V1512DRAFT_220556 [Lipomyces arxii]|uniref:uncharacterized protein n=1 Tax=Lipomyces arxii TaxID=56418 RepID=UPI0034CF59D4